MLKTVKWIGGLPEYATKGAACFDLKASAPACISRGETVLVKTDLRVELPEGYCLEVLSRSGLALKEGVFVVNAPGIVDEDYRGEIGVILGKLSGDTTVIKVGDRIAQARIVKVEKFNHEIAEQLSETERGTGGFGSTGK